MSEKITGIIESAFDLFHPGHVLALQKMKQECDYVIAAFHIDPSIERSTKNKPIQTIFERWIQLNGCKFVDKIIPYGTEAELENILKVTNINRRYLGNEYIDQLENITGYDVCIKKQIEFVFIMRDHNYSSTNLRQIIKNAT